MERRVAEALVPRLFEVYTMWHTRRRMRPGCSCSYCRTKLNWTIKIGRVNMREMIDKYYLPRMCVHGHYLDDTVKDAIYAWRRQKRREAREALSQVKEEVF